MRTPASSPCLGFAAVFFFAVMGLCADGRYTVESIQFIPQAYYVGDRVELRVMVRSSGLQILPPKSFPDVPWGEFHEARVVPREGLTGIHIYFTAYQTGGQSIPNLVCGDVVLQGLSASVRSLTEEGFREPAPPHGTLLLPSTRLLIALTVGLVIALPLGIAASYVWLRPWVKKIIGRYSERKPYRKLKKQLAALRNGSSEADSRGFYIVLLDAVKVYMHTRCEAGCIACTTRELGAYFERRFGGGSDKEALLDIFHFGDEVKFGGKDSSTGKQLRDVSCVEDIISRLENKDVRHAHL